MKNKKKDNKITMTVPALYKLHGCKSGIIRDLDCIINDYGKDKTVTIDIPDGTYTIPFSALENLINAVK